MAVVIVFILSEIISCGGEMDQKTSSESRTITSDNSAVTFDTTLSPAPSEDSAIRRNESSIHTPSLDSLKVNPGIENPMLFPKENTSSEKPMEIPMKKPGSERPILIPKKNTSSESHMSIPKENTGSEIPPLIPKDEVVAIKGTAMVYCPVTMIRNIPTIINAAISKDELSKAMNHFTEIVQEKNPTLKKDEINGNIKSTGINIYEEMGIMLVFDADDFKEMATPEDSVKSFKNTNILEWEWQLKPLHSTRKSIISFRFYYIDPVNNKREFILEKTINIVVRVDPRDYVDKWEDFILDDPKNTTTAILIPIISFFGGFFSRKKNKKDP